MSSSTTTQVRWCRRSVDGTRVWADPTSGEISVVADGGMAYRFDRDGLLQSVVSPADDRSPAATQFTLTGANPRLTKMKDPVSNRSVDLSYWGGPGCPTLPAGMVSAPGQLCEVESWDGRVTESVRQRERSAGAGGEPRWCADRLHLRRLEPVERRGEVPDR